MYIIYPFCNVAWGFEHGISFYNLISKFVSISMILRIIIYMITFRDSDWLRAVRLMQTLQLSVISANLCYVKLQGVDGHCKHVRCKCIA